MNWTLSLSPASAKLQLLLGFGFDVPPGIFQCSCPPSALLVKRAPAYCPSIRHFLLRIRQLSNLTFFDFEKRRNALVVLPLNTQRIGGTFSESRKGDWDFLTYLEKK